MVSVATILSCCVSLLVSLVLPVLLPAALSIRFRKQGILSAWALGAAGFVVTQVLIRLPILTALQSQPWFTAFSQKHLFAYAFSLAFTAGLFELAGRFAVAKLMKNRLTLPRSLAAGLGHGGIEAILLVGITYINNLVYIFMINSGTFDTVIAQTAASGVDPAQLELIRTQFLTASPALFLLGGFERILAMICHAAMSMLVCYGVAHKKVLPCILLCLAIHTGIDLTAGISLLTGSVLTQTAAYLIIYTILVVTAVFSLLILRELSRRWQIKEVSHDSEK